MSQPRLATGFWIAAKLREVQSAGGYASILIKGNDEAGAIHLVLRARDGSLKLAMPAINLAGGERKFVWHQDEFDDSKLNAYIARERRFDQDQWFVEIECDEAKFAQTFEMTRI